MGNANNPIILDNSIIGQMFKASGEANVSLFDEVFSNAREFVLTPAVYAEATVEPERPNVQAFIDWVDENSHRRLGQGITVDASDYSTYAPHLPKVAGGATYPDDLYGEMKFRFEIEHVFAEALYSNLDRATALESFGFFQQMRANQIGLFSDPDSVTAFQNGPVGALRAAKVAVGHRQFRLADRNTKGASA